MSSAMGPAGLAGMQQLLNVKQCRVEEAERELGAAREAHQGALQAVEARRAESGLAQARFEAAREQLLTDKGLRHSLAQFKEVMAYGYELNLALKSCRARVDAAQQQADDVAHQVADALQRLHAALREREKTQHQCRLLQAEAQRSSARRADAELDEFAELRAGRRRA